MLCIDRIVAFDKRREDDMREGPDIADSARRAGRGCSMMKTVWKRRSATLVGGIWNVVILSDTPGVLRSEQIRTVSWWSYEISWVLVVEVVCLLKLFGTTRIALVL